MEEMTTTVTSWRDLIESSFSLARSSPTLARQTLSTAAGYLNSTTSKGTTIVLGFWIAMIDLAQSEAVETCVMSLLNILENVLQLLRMEEVAELIKSLLILAASEPMTELLTNFTIFIKSAFEVIRTEEIHAFRDRLVEILEMTKQQQKEEKARRREERRRQKRRQFQSAPNLDTRFREGGFDEKETEIQGTPGEAQSESSGVPPSSSQPGGDENDDTQHQPQQSLISSLWGMATTTSTNFLYEGDSSDSDKQNPRDDGDNKSQQLDDDESIRQRARVESDVSAFAPTVVRHDRGVSWNDGVSAVAGGVEMRRGMDMFAPRVQVTSPYPLQDDVREWVKLMHLMDDLQDRGRLLSDEAALCRRLVREQNMELFILWQSYRNHEQKFFRHLQDLLVDLTSTEDD